MIARIGFGLLVTVLVLALWGIATLMIVGVPS